MFKLANKLCQQIALIVFSIFSVGILAFCGVAVASPFGAGNYGANVPYGGSTTLTISTNGNVSIPITPTDAGTLGTGTSIVTVTSTDVVGYKLYVRSSPTTDMVNGSSLIPASANGVPAVLAVNTWGYNTDATTNFVGMSLTDILIRTGTGPFTAGDITTVTYGIKIDNSKAAGGYTTTITYTAVPQTQ